MKIPFKTREIIRRNKTFCILCHILWQTYMDLDQEYACHRCSDTHMCSGWLRMQFIICSGGISPRQIRWIAVKRGNLKLMENVINSKSIFSPNGNQMAKIPVFDSFIFQHKVHFFCRLWPLKLLPIKHFLFQFSNALNGQNISLSF